MNFWCFVDEPSGYIYLIGGRAYVLSGSREQKLDLLRRLAQTDFCLAEASPVPRRFGVVCDGEVAEGLVRPESLAQVHGELFRPVLQSLRKKSPSFYPDAGLAHCAAYGRMPASPVCLTTCILVREDSSLEVLGNAEAMLPATDQAPDEKTTQPGANRTALRDS